MLLWDHILNVPAVDKESLCWPWKGLFFVPSTRPRSRWEDCRAPPALPQRRLLGWRSSCHKGRTSTLEVDCARKLVAVGGVRVHAGGRGVGGTSRLVFTSRAGCTAECTDCPAKSRYDWRWVSQYVKVLSPLWNLRPDIISCQNVAVWNLRSCFCWEPYFTLSSDTPPTWRDRFPCL
jgi:hypothetical protein